MDLGQAPNRKHGRNDALLWNGPSRLSEEMGISILRSLSINPAQKL